MDVRMPDGTIIKNVPEGTTKAQLQAKLDARTAPVQAMPMASPEPRSVGQELARQGKLTLAAALKGLGSLPMAAADFGIGARNLVTGERRPSPSDQWSHGIDQMLGKPETPIEWGSQVGGSMLAGAMVPAPSVKNPVLPIGQTVPGAPQGVTSIPEAKFDPTSMRLMALKKANDAGLSVPPATTNPTLTNRMLESLGGKVGTAQDASARNQPVIDALVKNDLGLKASDEVGSGTLSAIRLEQVKQGYAPIKGIGTIRLDSKYANDLDAVASKYVKAEQGFPGLTKSEIPGIVESLKQKSIDSDTAVDSLAVIREKADTAFGAGDKALGKSYKDAANALENAIERSLERRGQPELLSKYREARQMIAKTFSAEKALNPELGNFDANKFAQQLNRGKYLSGGMKKAGEASQAFKNATRLITDSGSVRNTDFILGGGAAAISGNPAPLIYPISRQMVRDFMLSPQGQALLATPSSRVGANPALVMGGVGLLGQ